MQVAVKVTAYVDKEIAELVSLLNDIPNVSTFSSCGGKLGKSAERAHIYFYYGEPYSTGWLESAQFANKLAMILAKNHSYDTDITLEWLGDKDSPFISIELHPKDISALVKILSDHMNEFSYDTL